MILSILICTIDSRVDKFISLYEKVLYQKVLWNSRHIGLKKWNVECLFEKDNKQISVGAKRQKLLERARGDYVVFIDDDDDVSNNYIKEICHAILDDDKKPDSIGFKIQCNISGTKETAIASNKYADWCENKDGYKYCRTPYHKTPVRRKIALKIGYKDLRYAEDYDYSKRLKESGLIKKETVIKKTMYYYNFEYEDPKTKYGLTN